MDDNKFFRIVISKTRSGGYFEYEHKNNLKLAIFAKGQDFL